MTQRRITLGTLTAFIVSLLAAPQSGGQQVVRPGVNQQNTQRPVAQLASVDSLVECAPVAAPIKPKPAVRRHKAVTPVKKKSVAAASRVASKPAVKAAPKKATVKRPVVRSARSVKPKAAPARSTTVVMCRPVRPVAPLANGTPTEESVIPVPQQLASTAPAAVAPPVPVIEEGPPLFVSTAPGIPAVVSGGGRSWLPFAVIPAAFVPFVHNGGTHHGTPFTPPIVPPTDTITTPPTDTAPTNPPVNPPVTPPTDTLTPPTDTIPTSPPVTPPTDTVPTPPVNPPTDTIPTPPINPPTDTLPGPPITPPTTVPEPGTLVMLGSGLLGLGGVIRRRRKR
jgi:hypothetical protein